MKSLHYEARPFVPLQGHQGSSIRGGSYEYGGIQLSHGMNALLH